MITNTNIFVSIASYKDTELKFTVDTLYENAKHPDKVFTSICQQDHPDNLISFTNQNINLINFNYVESQGVCWARKKVQQMYNNESYFLQLDSHIAMDKDWDALLIDQMEQASEVTKNKLIFAQFPSGYEIKNGERSFHTKCHSRTVLRNDDVFKFHNGSGGDSNFSEPINTPYLNAGLMFGHGSFMIDCPYDDDIYIQGEELLNTVKAFTHGYDLFNPSVHMGWHLYKSWSDEDKTKWNVHFNEEDDKQRTVRHWERSKSSDAKLTKILLGELPQELGNKRTIKDFEEYIKRPILKTKS